MPWFRAFAFRVSGLFSEAHLESELREELPLRRYDIPRGSHAHQT